MNTYSIRCVKENLEIPISLDLVKTHLKITNSNEDELLIAIIRASVKIFEGYTARSLLNKEWCAIFKNLNKFNITLPTRTVNKIIEITLIDENNNTTVFNEKHYFLEENSSELNLRIIPYAKILKINYLAGYGDSHQDVPHEIVTSILQHIAFQYENRESGEVFNLKNYDQFRKMRI